jgi:transcriptional regulator with PAS, ATPase and Fis domain
MIEIVKKGIWDILRLKNVSFAMVYKDSGDIIWQKGRKINGENVKEFPGFLRELICKIREQPEILESGLSKGRFNLLESENIQLPDPQVKCVIILKINHYPQYFLYLESRKQNYFSHNETSVFIRLLSMLAASIERMETGNKEIATVSGSSAAIKIVQTQMLRYAVEIEPILLLGETGVGKNHIARAIHRLSGRSGKFVQVHIPSIPEELFESEVFGHKKGAFTNAYSDRTGLIEYASAGTLFLDEISEVPLSFQAKLLQFLDTKRYRVLGDPEEKESDVRIIAATNRNIALEVEEKRFRKDLFYRLNVLPIRIPPLRKRKEDIKEIVRDEIHHLRGKQTSRSFWEEILNYHWPGNIREVIHILKRAGIDLQEPITGEDIRELTDYFKENETDDKPIGKDFVEKIFNDFKSGKNFWEVVKKPFLNRDYNREQVKAVISRSLSEVGGKYKSLLKLFGIKEEEYNNLMRFFYDNDLKS